MEFRVPCECGQQLKVSVTDAGTTKNCGCGRTVSIPRLSKLRETAGLDAYEFCPAQEINQAVADGAWPVSADCCQCGFGTDSIVQLQGICERSWTQDSDGDEVSLRQLASFAQVAVLGVFGLFFSFRRASSLVFGLYGETKEFGRDVYFSAPFRLCDACQRAAKSKRVMQTWTRSLPALKKVLAKFPDTQFSFVKMPANSGSQSADNSLRRCA